MHSTVQVVLYILGALLLFVFALDMMISSFQLLGRDVMLTVVRATTNPFTALFIGLLVTALIQSSSTTTAMVVALVASGSLSIASAVPIIMGANIGTTITATIVSLGFISEKKEFRRAVSAGAYHCFFNILTAAVLFPLEYYYGFLSSASSALASSLFQASAESIGSSSSSIPGSLFGPLTNGILSLVGNGFLRIVLSFGLLFSSILIFRRLIAGLLKARSPEAFSKFFFNSPIKSFTWGLITTAAIRSSTITTSVVVPVVAKRIARLSDAAPFILGANIGTTVTAFIAALLNINATASITVALAHILFNLIGVLIFFPLPWLRQIPLYLAGQLGKLTLRFPLACFVFILLTFFFIPFCLIYFNRSDTKTIFLEYEHYDGVKKSYYKAELRYDFQLQNGHFYKFSSRGATDEPSTIIPVYHRNRTMFFGNTMFLLEEPGACWSSEIENRRATICVEAILPEYKVGNLTFDSVFVFQERHWIQEGDTALHRLFIDPSEHLLVRQEWRSSSDSLLLYEAISLKE